MTTFNNNIDFLLAQALAQYPGVKIHCDLKELVSVSHHSFRLPEESAFEVEDKPVVESAYMSVYNFVKLDKDGEVEKEYRITLSETETSNFLDFGSDFDFISILKNEFVYDLIYDAKSIKPTEVKSLFIDILMPDKAAFVWQILNDAEEEVIDVGRDDPSEVREFRVNTGLYTSEER